MPAAAVVTGETQSHWDPTSGQEPPGAAVLSRAQSSSSGSPSLMLSPWLQANPAPAPALPPDPGPTYSDEAGQEVSEDIV